VSSTKTSVPTGLALTALDPTFREQPHKYLDQLRSIEPVHQDREFDRVVLTRAEDIGAVLNDRSMGSDPRKSRPGSFSRLQLGVDENFQPSMLHMDDPDHKRLRDLVSRAFNQRAVDAARPQVVQIAARLLEEVAAEACFDVIEAYAKPLPTIVIAEMLGVDPADQQDFKLWSDTQMHFVNPRRTPEQKASMEWGKASLTSYFTEVIRKRRKQRGTDLISILISAEEDNEKLDESEINAVCQLLLAAGNVTTTDLIGNGVLALLRHPSEFARLRAHPELARDAVEEVLRYDSPVAQANRITAIPRQIGGCPVAAGQSITVSLIAGNHDPSLHSNPDIFDIERSNKRHYSFGGGAHFCLGAPLARAEAQIALSMLVAKFPKLRLMEGFTPTRKSLPSFNGLESLWVNID
jgi:cytochrome P450